MSEKKLKNAITHCPCWPSTHFNHASVCVFVFSPEITPPTALQTQDGFAVVGQDGCFGPGLRSALFMQRLSTPQTPNTHQSLESVLTRASKHPIATHLMLLWWFSQAKQLQAFLILIIRNVLDMWKGKKNKQKTNKRKHIFILLYRRDRQRPKTLPVLCLHTNNKRRGEVFIWMTKAHTSDRWRAAAQCAHSWVGVLSHCSMRRNFFTAHSLVQVSAVSGAQNIQLYVERHYSEYVCVVNCLRALFFFFRFFFSFVCFFLYCVIEREVVNRQNFV